MLLTLLRKVYFKKVMTFSEETNLAVNVIFVCEKTREKVFLLERHFGF